VKQTVMTSVYGITYVGARQQMSNRLKDKGWTDDEAIFRTASYAARVRPSHPAMLAPSPSPACTSTAFSVYFLVFCLLHRPRRLCAM